MIVPVCACGFLGWTDHGRMQRVEHVSGLAGRAESANIAEARSPTGYANRQRELIVPERNENSFEWIAQTQQMFATGELRVRHVDYDNAPHGREVNRTSPYRWWLGAIAWLDHTISGRPIGLAVERAALVADPALHALLLIGCTILVAWQFGAFAAALMSVGLVAIFPFAAGFLPGAPDDHGLANGCALVSVLLLLAGTNALRPEGGAGADELAARQGRRWFALAGVVGGFGVWLGVATQVPMVAGIFLGALIAAWIMRRGASGASSGTTVAAPWHAWALSGAATILVASVAEYFPAQLGSWSLDSVHPLYGVAWLGAGELLVRAWRWGRREKILAGRRDGIAVGLALAAVTTVPAIMWKTGSQGFLARNLLWARLTDLPDGAMAASFQAWLLRDGPSAAVVATLLPLLAIAPAAWLLLRRSTKREARIPLAIACGPALIALGFAWRQLSWWSTLDGTLLVLMVAATARGGPAVSRPSRWLWAALAGGVAIAGTIQLLPKKSVGAGLTLTSSESAELIERHLAHWLAKRTGKDGAVVYAPPHQTTTLSFYGGLRGIGTFAPENRAGFGTSLSIAGVKTIEEAQGLLQARGVRYVVVPSWDPFFDEFARLYLDQSFSNRTSFFIGELRRWNLPPWLRPVPYQMPVSGGFEGQSVLVFEVVDEQNPAVAAGRLAEYLVETGQLDQAASASEALRRFPGDVGALAARAQVQSARGDAPGVAQTLDSLLSRLASGADRFLPWDRRVSLAIVLARGDRLDLATEQVRRCLAELSEQKLRSLSTGSLYGLMVLSHSFGVGTADPKLRELALELLPADLRAGL